MILAKPEKRAPLPKRPLPRTSTKTKRSKRLPRCKDCAHLAKHHDPIRHECLAVAFCPCAGYQKAIGKRQKAKTPEKALIEKCDDLWSKTVKAGEKRCEITEPHDCGMKYGMSMQAMHGIPRTFKATRWLLINGFSGCPQAHKFFTERPEAWSAYLLLAWGLETFTELWRRARSSEVPDLSATYAALKSEAEKGGP